MALHPPRLKLAHYFVIEAVVAFACIIYIYCLFFWTKNRFGYTDTQNLILIAFHGLVYAPATLYGGRLADRIGYDRTLAIAFAGMIVTLFLGWIPHWWIAPFLAIGPFTFFMALLWPTLEAVILHCPGRLSMPERLGIYNLTWTVADGFGFIVGALLLDWKRDSILWAPGLVLLGLWLWVWLQPRHCPQGGETAMETPHRGDDVPRPVQQRFMRAGWLGNGLAFVMLAGFSALSPCFSEQLRLGDKFTIWLASAMPFARGIAFLIFWKWEGWHYRMGWSQCALWLAPAALAIIFFSTQAIWFFIGLLLFGLATGLSYSASLYYSLAYGTNKGEHGGLHEAMLGAGTLTGSVLAAVASTSRWGTPAAQWTILGLVVALNLGGLWKIQRRN